jgi:hypothetical protein
MIKKIYLFFLLIIGIGISVIAGVFSISGLTTIFKGSYLSVLLMGSFLEIAKVNISIYLHLFWSDIKKLLAAYLLFALLILMAITSLGIYGYLSKSFFTSTDTSSMVSKVESFNISLELEKSKVKTARDEIDYLNNLPRDEKKSWHIYRIQKLSKDIDGYTTKIDAVNEKYITEKVKLNSLESEVGPLKYLAMIIYKDKSQDAIAKSVQVFIIFIVVVFDPLAILTILSAINGFEILKDKEEKEKLNKIHNDIVINEKIKIKDQDITIKEEVSISENENHQLEINISQPEIIIEEKHEVPEIKPIIEEKIEIVESKEIIKDEIIIKENQEKKDDVYDLISTNEIDDTDKVDNKILDNFNKKENKNKKKEKKQKDILEQINPDLLELSNIFEEEEKPKQIIIKERKEIEIDRDGEFENDMINFIIDEVSSQTEDLDKIDKMYSQTPMIGGNFNDNV